MPDARVAVEQSLAHKDGIHTVPLQAGGLPDDRRCDDAGPHQRRALLELLVQPLVHEFRVLKLPLPEIGEAELNLVTEILDIRHLIAFQLKL